MKSIAIHLAVLMVLRFGLPSVNGQTLQRWEVGAHLVRLDLDSIGEGPVGLGGRVSYFANRFVALEAEANRYFKDTSNNFGHTQVVAGLRSGDWIGPVGIFGKVRPGVVHLGGATAARNPGRENNFALDVGGVIMVGRGRAGMRIDAADTIIFWGSQPFNTGLARPVRAHNRQLSIGFVIRL